MIDFSNLNYLSAAINVFGVFCCAYLLAWPALRFSAFVPYAQCIPFGIACVLALPLINHHSFLTDNRGLLFLFALYYPVFHISLVLSAARSLCIYLWAIALFMFPSNISCLVDAAIHTDNTRMSLGRDGLVFNLIFSVLLCLAVYIIVSKWDKRILSPLHTPETLWLAWLSIPILFLGLNIALLPEDYRLLRINSLYATYLFFSGSLFVLFTYLSTIFYSHMIEYVHIQEYKEAQRIADIQRLQYDNLITQIEADRHVRHDFKHTLNLLSKLAASGDTKSLLSYIREYTRESSGIIVKNYCRNPAINAVINYYEDKAQQEGVITNIQVDLPDELAMPDTEFCSLIGNLMENAIDAAKEAPSPNRRFSISIRVQNDSTLYIVSSNDYNGHLIPGKANTSQIYLSTKGKHHGLGLQSIHETVDKYGGTLRIHPSDSEFLVDIAIRV